MLCVFQSHIRACGGKEWVLSVGLELMISPGVWSAVPPITCSGTIRYELFSL